MIELLGWIALLLGGAWAFGSLAFLVVTRFGLGGLEWLVPGLIAWAAAAAAWSALIVWWSPMTIGFE